MSETWLTQSASDLGRAIDAGEIDPVDLTRAYLDAIKNHEFGPRIYARLTETRAMAEAQAASRRARLGQRRGLLDGVPISWKDLFDTAGVATEAGSALLRGRVPRADAKVLMLATTAGSVCLGKTHMSELAFSGLGLNPVTESPPCVNDVEAVSGGSSSGAAASVAFGLAAAAIGSDTGGSVRIPAAWNDLVGLKTSMGRVSVAGSVPLCAGFDTVGPLCRSVEDAARLLAMLDGSRPADLRGASLDGVRLARLETVAMDDLRDTPAQAFEAAAKRLETVGAHISSLSVPALQDAFDLALPLFAGEAYAQWETEIESNPDVMFHEIRTRFRAGRDVTARQFIQGWQRLEEIRGIWAAATAGFDAVILPSSPIMPPNQARLLSDSDYYQTENLLALRNTRVGNLMGLASLTLPTQTGSAGLMLLSKPHSEEKLLRIGAAAEVALA